MACGMSEGDSEGAEEKETRNPNQSPGKKEEAGEEGEIKTFSFHSHHWDVASLPNKMALELVVDLQCMKKQPTPVLINGEGLEMVDTYKLLGMHLNNKLDWLSNTEAPTGKDRAECSS